MEDRLNWIIFGAGAIGTYIGSSLILHGQNVVFLEKAESVPAILEQGLRLNIHGQEHRIIHPDIYSNLPEVLALATFDVSVFALKSYDTQTALDLIRPFSSNFPPVLCLQNGVENESAIESVLGPDKVISATVSSSISRRGPGDILLERERGIGIADNHPLSTKIMSILTSSDLNARLYKSAPAMKWSKMLTNLMANASSAILDMTPAEILSNPDLYAVEVAQLREAINVCHTQQIQFVDLPGTPVRLFAWSVKNLTPRLSRIFLSRIAGRGRGHKMPSFHIDLYSGRGKSEVDFLNGAVVRFGERFNIPTPVNRWLNQTLLSLTRGKLPLDEFTHQPEKYLDKISSISGGN